MKIMLARIPEEGSHYDGDEPGAIMQVEGDKFIRDPGDVRYHLYAQRVSDELVVRGELDADLQLRGARCSEFFSTTVGVSDFLRAYPAPEGTDSVDITEDLREEILLHVPGFPLCSEACPSYDADASEEADEDRDEERPNPWSALDGLNL